MAWATAPAGQHSWPGQLLRHPLLPTRSEKIHPAMFSVKKALLQMATPTSCVTRCLLRTCAAICHLEEPGQFPLQVFNPLSQVGPPHLQHQGLAALQDPGSWTPSIWATCLQWVRSVFLPQRREDTGNHLKRTQMERGEVIPESSELPLPWTLYVTLV